MKDVIRSIEKTLSTNEENIRLASEEVCRRISKGGLVFVVGAGASGLVCKEMAGQMAELGIKAYPLTNDLAEAQPVSFCKGGYEGEKYLADHYSALINDKDMLICISASGGTGFINQIIVNCIDNDIFIIAITENADSPIGLASDLVIRTFGKPEHPSATKTQVCALVVVHEIDMKIAEILGIDDKKMIEYMQLNPIDSKRMGDK